MVNCREAGKGFIHINPEGYIESCALIPHSKYNIIATPLKMCLENLYRDNQQCAHLYESLEHHPCMSHRQDLCGTSLIDNMAQPQRKTEKNLWF